MRTYSVYMVINKINNMKYIGQTNNFEKRKKEHLALNDKYSNNKFHQALIEFGKENFEWRVLEEVTSRKEAERKEIYYIEKYDTLNPNGYNMTKGGLNPPNLRAIVMLDLDGNYIEDFVCAMDCEKKYKINHSNIISVCKNKTKRYKKYLFMYKEDYLSNGSKKYVRPKQASEYRKRKIVQLTLNGEFIKEYNSIIEASMETQIRRTTITCCVNHQYKSAGGYQWISKEEYNAESKKQYNIKRTEIVQLSLEGKYINKFESCAHAERSLGLREKAYKVIYKVLDNPNKTAYGYRWVRLINYNKDYPVPSLRKK